MQDTLVRLGLEAEALAAGRVPAATLVPHMTGPDAEALVTALGNLASPAVAELLRALEPEARDRAVRKEIRRSLYRLRQRGVPVPEPSRDAPAAVRAPAPTAEGLVSPVDGRGDRLIWILRAQPGGGALLIEAVVNEPDGLRSVQALDVSRKQVRAARRQIEKDTGIRFVPADWRTLDALLVEGHERARGGERDYLALRPRLTADAPAAPVEPVSPRAAPPAAEEIPGLAASSGALLEEPEFRSWYPSPEAAAPFVEEIAAVRASPLVLSRVAQEERIREVLRRAASSLLPPVVLGRRLAATAYVLAESGRDVAARRALAVAAAVRERPADAIEVPFMSGLVERALGTLLAERTKQEEETERGSLVMTPGQFLRDRASSRPGRTRG